MDAAYLTWRRERDCGRHSVRDTERSVVPYVPWVNRFSNLTISSLRQTSGSDRTTTPERVVSYRPHEPITLHNQIRRPPE